MVVALHLYDLVVLFVVGVGGRRRADFFLPVSVLGWTDHSGQLQQVP